MGTVPQPGDTHYPPHLYTELEQWKARAEKAEAERAQWEESSFNWQKLYQQEAERLALCMSFDRDVQT